MGVVNIARIENHDKIIDKYFGMIETSIRRLDHTLMDLIELAQTRRGSNKLSEVNVKKFVVEILDSFKDTPDFDRINFEISIDPNIEVFVDHVLLLSVFQNLIDNAITYCDKAKPWIRIHVISSGNGIELNISDNGKGIPMNIKNRVFEMFYRGHSESSGSGLGLFIVKNALEKMRGKISFDSKEGQGTSFIVYIPSVSVLV
jgi:signal transduction histidine kinase